MASEVLYKFWEPLWLTAHTLYSVIGPKYTGHYYSEGGKEDKKKAQEPGSGYLQDQLAKEYLTPGSQSGEHAASSWSKIKRVACTLNAFHLPSE